MLLNLGPLKLQRARVIGGHLLTAAAEQLDFPVMWSPFTSTTTSVFCAAAGTAHKRAHAAMRRIPERRTACDDIAGFAGVNRRDLGPGGTLLMAWLRGIVSVVAGFIVASLVMLVVEYTNGHVIYPELGKAAEGVTDREVVRQLMATAPTGALLVVLVGWILGSLAGGWVAARTSLSGAMRHAIIVGVLLTAAGIFNNLAIPPPAWFWIGIGVFLPSAWYGGRMAARP
jgi:hypothetical protein